MYCLLRTIYYTTLLVGLVTACEPSAQQNWQLTIIDSSTMQSTVLRDSDADNRFIVINYWAEWCKPCIKEMPELNDFATKFKDQAIVLGVNFDNKHGDELVEAMGAVNMLFPAITSDLKSVFDLPDITGLPTTVILNSKGEIQNVLQGPQTLQSLTNGLNQGSSIP